MGDCTWRKHICLQDNTLTRATFEGGLIYHWLCCCELPEDIDLQKLYIVLLSSAAAPSIHDTNFSKPVTNTRKRILGTRHQKDKKEQKRIDQATWGLKEDQFTNLLCCCELPEDIDFQKLYIVLSSSASPSIHDTLPCSKPVTNIEAHPGHSTPKRQKRTKRNWSGNFRVEGGLVYHWLCCCELPEDIDFQKLYIVRRQGLLPFSRKQ